MAEDIIYATVRAQILEDIPKANVDLYPDMDPNFSRRILARVYLRVNEQEWIGVKNLVIWVATDALVEEIKEALRLAYEYSLDETFEGQIIELV